MKKIILMAFMVVAASFSGAYAGTPVSQEQLPKGAREFIIRHFPGDNVRKAEKEQGRRGMEYEVDLTSGAEIDFRDDGTWKEVKAAKGRSVPAAIIPAAIATHVKTNYSGQTIVEISRKRGGYEIELSNGTELRLTEDAKPLSNQEKGQRGNRPRR